MTGWGEPWLSDLLAGGYLGLLSLMWALLALGVPQYGAKWRLPAPAPGAAPAAGPRVSVCVPARDEAANIGACVQAVLASDYPDLELIVVDDRSSDGTSDAARAAAAEDPRFHLSAGSDPPAGWSGKAWACRRASGEASGALLLFVDADVRLHPGTISALVAARAAEGLGLLSLFGRWQLVSFWERALIPTVGWFIRGAVDLDRVNKPGAEEAFANGQLILLTREAYDAVDGHGAVKDQILDDVRLAAAVKRRGFATGLRVAPWAFEVRLYRSLAEILNGYTKNLYEGMGRRPALGLGAVLFVLVGTLAPYAGLAGGLVGRLALGWSVPELGWLAWLAGICALQLLFRARVESFDGRPPGIAWVHPISNVLLVWILLRSMGRVEVEWKGRRFVDGRASAGPRA